MTSRSQPSLRPRSENLPLRPAVQGGRRLPWFLIEGLRDDLFLGSGLSLDLILELVKVPPSSGLIHLFSVKLKPWMKCIDMFKNAFHCCYYQLIMIRSMSFYLWISKHLLKKHKWSFLSRLFISEQINKAINLWVNLCNVILFTEQLDINFNRQHGELQLLGYIADNSVL